MVTKSNGHLRDKIKKLYKRDKHKIVAATKAITDATQEAKERFSDVEKSMEKYAKANPWKTMGFSILAGAIVAKVLHLRK
jgi:ElaB/YqjD/DUF883 family membrane-anchored ribosome-binding protein